MFLQEQQVATIRDVIAANKKNAQNTVDEQTQLLMSYASHKPIDFHAVRHVVETDKAFRPCLQKCMLHWKQHDRVCILPLSVMPWASHACKVIAEKLGKQYRLAKYSWKRALVQRFEENKETLYRYLHACSCQLFLAHGREQETGVL